MKKNLRTIMSISLSVILVLISLSWSASAGTGKKTLKIGMVTARTGKAASFIHGIEMGAQYAVDYINSQGGVVIGDTKYTLKLIVGDDKSTPTEGKYAFERLIYRDKVNFIVGPWMSALSMAVGPLSTKEKIIYFSVTSGDRNIRPEWPYCFRVKSGIIERIYPYIKWIHKTYPEIKTIAIMGPNDETGKSTSKWVRKVSPELGIKVVSDEFFARGTNDFYPILTKILSNKPGGIILNGGSQEGQTTRQAREMGYCRGFFFSIQGKP